MYGDGLAPAVVKAFGSQFIQHLKKPCIGTHAEYEIAFGFSFKELSARSYKNHD